jgi:transposase
MAIKSGVGREEMLLLPECVEDYVGHNNAVRVVDVFVDGLDFVKLGIVVNEFGVGASSYDPKAMLKLFIYGYLNRMRSSRDLEKAANRNLEVIWLMRKLTPDHWTINEFRKKHAGKFKGVFREFHLVCGQLGLFGAELVAIDSAFFKAVNNPSKNYTRAKVDTMLRRIDEATEAYLSKLEASEKENAGQGGEEIKDLKTRLETLSQKRERAVSLLEAIEKSPTGQISLTDADASSLKKGQQAMVGYQVQIAGEDVHHLIVADETQLTGGDRPALPSMARQSRETLDAKDLAAVTDGGYYSVEGIQECEKAGITTYVPEKAARKAGEGLYEREDFGHEESSDTLICPQGQKLSRHADTILNGGERYKVYYNSAACRGCALRAKCTSGEYRKINIPYNLAAVEALRERWRSAPGMSKKRSSIVEHIFGTMKFWMGAGTFMTRGLEKVSGEIKLTCLAYNLKRVINIFGSANLTAWLKARPMPA